MPVNTAGKHFSRPADMNRAAAMAPPGMGDDDSGEQTIELKKKADGTFCTVENGQEMEHPDLASAMDAVNEKFGDDQQDTGDMNDSQDQY